MAGLLDTLFRPQNNDAIAALSAGLLRGDFGGGLLGAQTALSSRERRELEKQLLQAQVNETQAQAQQRSTAAQAAQREAQEAQRIQGLIQNAGMPQPGMGSTAGVNGALPPEMRIGAQPQIGGGGLDFEGLYKQGVPYKRLEELAGTRNLGQSEVARTVSVPGPNGEKMVLQLDKFGKPVGQPMPEHEAAQILNLGNRQVGVIPRAGQSFQMGQSPDSAASNALGWANHGLSRQRLSFDQNKERSGNVPSGYRAKPDGSLEYIPGGPADPMAARRAAPTEDERKAAGWLSQAQKGFADMQKAVKLEPGASKPSLWESMPIIPEATVNMTRSPARQMFNQGASALGEAVLRAATGAGVNRDEAIQKARELTPQWGDDEKVIAQKEASARNYIDSLAVRAGRAGAPGQSPPSTPDNDPLGLRR